MAPRHAKTRSKSPSRKRRGNHAEDFDRPPSTEVPFSAPWHGAPKDEFSMTAHLWPIELFEAFYGVLWKAVSKKDPKWARRFHAALMEQVMGSAGVSPITADQPDPAAVLVGHHPVAVHRT
jgi:hypothetical protein